MQMHTYKTNVVFFAQFTVCPVPLQISDNLGRLLA